LEESIEGTVMNIVVFEDEHVTRLHPVSLGRPAYAISCGAYRLVDWLRELSGSLRGIVRPYLADLQRTDFADLAQPLSAGPTLMVNARVVPSVDVYQQIRFLMKETRAGVVLTDNVVAAVVLGRDADATPADLDPSSVAGFLQHLGAHRMPALEARLPLFVYPHDIIRFNMQTLASNLEHKIAHGQFRELAPGVFAGAGVTVSQFVETNTKSGPIVLDENSTVGPFCFLRGPAYLGRGAKLIEHAAIKDGVSAGHTTKIGGEVEAAVIEPYTNKQHHGFLGHSYLGSWINLGAGTCNSDLKNTYGKVNLEYRGEKVNTGMQFVGCMIGDYAKTAINTGIFTGKVIGACSMLYGFVTTNVPSFVNYARLFGQVTELPPEVMIATQQRMFQRRSVVQRPCDIQLIRDMYEQTRDERQLAGEPLSL
jgi:UDP-N-acetylglucosamine diphosphorylase/glucosamine-1-phosphate N-acetyltransferase